MPQAGGQVAINKNVPGPGPLRSNTTPMQLQALAALLANPEVGQNLAAQGMLPPHAGGPGPGIPGVPS